MFRQVNVDISERKFEYILCSDFTVEQLRASQLQKVTFGSASAPYLAVRSLHHQCGQFPLTKWHSSQPNHRRRDQCTRSSGIRSQTHYYLRLLPKTCPQQSHSVRSSLPRTRYTTHLDCCLHSLSSPRLFYRNFGSQN